MMKRISLVVAALTLGITAAVGARQVPDADVLRGAEPPANAIWVDSLDMSRIGATVIRPPHGRGPGRRTGREGAPPDAPPVYALGGVTYPHTIPMQSDRDHGVLFGKIGTPARQAGTR